MYIFHRSDTFFDKNLIKIKFTFAWTKQGIIITTSASEAYSADI